MRKLYSVLAALFITLASFAQWTSNTQVNTEASASSTGDCKTIATSDGKTWMAFFKNLPAPNYFEMRAQLLDKDGTRLLGPEGVVVNNTPHPSFTTIFSAACDANNNLIVAFANASTNIIYVNKISTSGAQVWNSGGITFSNGLAPKLCVLGNGDVIVSWLSTNTTKARMQRLDAATGAPQWAAAVDVLTANPAHRSAPGHILPLSDNGFIHVFHNRASSFGTSSTLWAQRYDLNGVAQWAAPVQLSDKSTAYNLNYSAAMHNDTLFIGYGGATGLRTDGFVQRLNPDGTIPWGINGSDFATDNTYYEFDINIMILPATNTVWATGRLTNTSQGSQGAYVQKYNKSTGARQFTDNAKAVYPIIPAPYVVPLGITLFNDNMPLLLLGRYNSAVSQFLYATKLNANGNFAWPGDTVALGAFPASKLRMALTNVVGTQAVVGWVETKGTFPQPYAQPIRVDGSTGLTAPVADFNASITSVCRNSTVQFINNSSGIVTTYSWSFPGGSPSSSSLPNPAVTYNTDGVYSATLTVSNAAGSHTFTRTNYITVTSVTPAATLNGRTSICADTVVSYAVTGTNLGSNPTYTWVINGLVMPYTASSTPPMYLTGGNYSIACQVNSTAQCAIPSSISTNTIQLVVNRFPKISLDNLPGSVCRSEGPYLLSGLPGGGTFSGPGISGVNTFTPVVAGAGNATVSYSVTQNGCTSVARKVIAVDDCASRHLKLDQSRAIFVMSNPTNGKFNLKVNTDLYSKLFITLYNNIGQRLVSQSFTGLTYGSVLPMDITLMPAGIYNLYIYSDETGVGSNVNIKMIKH